MFANFPKKIFEQYFGLVTVISVFIGKFHSD